MRERNTMMQKKLEELGIHYTEVLARFAGNEVLMERFMKKFPQDQTFQQLCDAIEKKDMDEIGVAAHTLKGVSANLGFQKLFQKCSDLVAVVRNGETDKVPGLFEDVKQEYYHIVKGLEEL